MFVGIGGGRDSHRFGELAREEGQYVGHMLASDDLDFAEGGRWREAVTEVVRSTRAAFLGAGGGVKGGVAAWVDERAFAASDREELVKHLSTLGVEHRYRT